MENPGKPYIRFDIQTDVFSRSHTNIRRFFTLPADRTTRVYEVL